MIRDHEARLAALEAVTYLCQEDRRRALGRVRNKLYRLKQELRGLKSGLLRWEE
ncbi:MAG: hypothetical protein GX989_08505 [Firmicutes bacterium]|nr:hypothetical protein [Bacillota bacterium]